MFHRFIMMSVVFSILTFICVGETVSPGRMKEVREVCSGVLSDTGRTIPGEYGKNPIPDHTKMINLAMPDENTARITLEFPTGRLSPGDFDSFTLNRIAKRFETALDPLEIPNLFLYAKDPETGKVYGFDELTLPEKGAPIVMDETEDGPLPSSPEKKEKIRYTNPVVEPGNIQGSLSGKTIYLNPGHGWFDDVDFGRWRVQRGVVSDYGILEDFSNAETINIFTVPYLINAGATVLTVREMDHNTNMVIVDNADGTSNPSNGTYVETGSWYNSSARGFKQKTGDSWVGVSINPFDSGGGNRLADVNASGPTATARWTPNIPRDGYYWVYASWSRYSARSTKARYIVHHTGGDTPFLVDQTRFGYCWFPIGRFYFKKGLNPDTGSVELTNHADNGANVSADVVRFGGGMGDMERHTHGTSGRPRFEEEAVDYLQWNGFGSSGLLYTGIDDEAGGWSDRTQFPGWMSNYDTGDNAYMAHHTNAGGGSGIRTYIHSSASQASKDLRDFIHDEFANDVLEGWGVDWTSSSYKRTGNYGENSQSNLKDVPGFLMEALFHDNSTDTSYYRDPRFRMIMARAYTQGFIKYFANKDGVTVELPPEPPEGLWAKSIGGGQVQLGWKAPPYNTGGGLLGDAATGYKVFCSTNGYGFDNGMEVTQRTATISGLTPGALYFFRVCATNDGGQSFPTETLAVRLPSTGGVQALLVNGFDRNSRSLPPWETVSHAGTIIRMEPKGYQTFDYTVQHAFSMHRAGISFDGASNEAVESGDIGIDNYQGLFWICGEESTVEETFSNAEQTKVTNFLSVTDHCLFVSGAEILWDLDYKGSASDKAFAAGTLRAGYDGDDADTYQVQGSGAPFDGLSSFSFDPSSGAPYDAEYPDQLKTAGGSTGAMSYVGGNGGISALAYNGTNKVVLLGFPFETITSESVRDDIMSRVAGFFNLNFEPTPVSYTHLRAHET